MGREIRRVPKNWEHPKNTDGNYQPMFDQTYWNGLVGHFIDDLKYYLWPPKDWPDIREWFESFPDKAYYRPRFLKDEAICYQIYETVTEGTPVSPVFETLDELKQWLVSQGYSQEAAEGFAEDGWVPSFAIVGQKWYDNIECAAIPKSS